ncbi:MAG TPA: SBBP repeat-containing protein, partial [Pyrinomonadaceae bacterium]
AEITGEGRLPGRVNYFRGGARRVEATASRYARVRYHSVYEGVDMVYYGDGRRLEYDFVVAPGAEARAVALDFRGAERLEIDAAGDLVLHTPAGVLRQHRPFAYQQDGDERRAVESRYVMRGRARVGFEVGAYDRSKPLVIDPVLSYSTYLGGEGFEMPAGIAVDGAGNVYVTGTVVSDDFPVTDNAFQKRKAGGGRPGFGQDVFVTKLRPAGKGAADLVYSTYLGGGAADYPFQMAADAAGNAHVVGVSESADFPATANSYRQSFREGFFVKLAPDGGLAYSTSLPGAGIDLALGADGTVYVTGNYYGSGITLTPDAHMKEPHLRHPNGTPMGFFIERFRPEGRGAADLLYASYSRARRVAVDPAGNVYLADTNSGAEALWPTTPNAVLASRPKNDVCYQDDKYGDVPCSDAYAEKLRPAPGGGYELAYATYLGGKGIEKVIDAAADARGFMYVMGTTSSTPASWLPGNTNEDDFPITENAIQRKNNGNDDLFLTKIDTESKAGGAAALAYSTLFGGHGKETPYGLALAPDGAAYVAGETDSADFVITANVLQAKYGGDLGNTISKPGGDGFVIKIDRAGSTLGYSTYLGTASGDGIRGLAVGQDGTAYVTGFTWSEEFPSTAGAFQPQLDKGGFTSGIDAFVSRISEQRKPDEAAFAAGTGAFNPTDDPMSFVRQQYRDFLNREADDEGLAFWTNEITKCGADAACREVKRVNVSAAFFLSIESQRTGYFFYRLHRAAFGTMPRFADYRAAQQALGRGVIVQQSGWEAKLEANRRAFVGEWVSGGEFAARYGSLSNADYVDTLLATAGLAPAGRDALVAGLDSGAETRASVLLKVADDPELYRREFNRAFVLAEYFGYLQRDANAGQDTDFTGLEYWLGKLEDHGGNYVAAEMVKAFLDSTEYRRRFGPE